MTDDETLVLTPGEVAARALREDHALARRREGRSVWRRPLIASLEQWIGDRWAADWPAEQLLSGTQSLLLWLAEVERDSGLLAPLACAREALRAERLLLDYRIDPATLPAWSLEQRHWLDWRQRVQRRRREQGWLLPAELPALIEPRLQAAPHEAIRLCGFDLPQTPAHAALLARLRARGAVDEVPPSPAASVLRQRLASPELQYRAVARRLAQTLTAADPATPPRIVVALADVEGARLQLEGWLRECLAPWLAEEGANAERPWRWSAGQALTLQPIIAAADAVFALDLQANATADLSRLLLAPALWPEPLRAPAAELDRRLRELGRPRLALASLCALARGSRLAEPLERLLATLRAEPRRAKPSAWARHLALRLEALGWPGAEKLSSPAFQSVQELRRRLARLAGLDPMSGPLALARLRLWLGELLRAGFEPRAEHAQPILITDLEEAAGLPCDLRLIVDADAAHLPARREPTPFLDIAAQRAAGVPEASAAGSLAAARAQVAALSAGARTVELYSADLDARGAATRPSPLFTATEMKQQDAAPVSALEAITAAPARCTLGDDPVPPVSAAENLCGSAGLLQSWFGAPFYAFCRFRLHIEPLPEVPHGLAPQVQGTVLHDALDAIWGELGTRSALRASDEPALDALIERLLRPLIERALPIAETGQALHALERARLHDLLRQWLAHEARRVDDFRVIAREHPLETQLAGLPLRLRIDRIDCVHTPHGRRLLLIDYKTGAAADPKGWDAERLREPQLPLYAVVLPRLPVDGEDIALGGIAFGHLKDGHPALAAASDWRESLIEDSAAPKIDWLEREQGWAAALSDAVRRFLAGEAGLGDHAAQAYDAWLLPLAGDDDREDRPEEAA